MDTGPSGSDSSTAEGAPETARPSVPGLTRRGRAQLPRTFLVRGIPGFVIRRVLLGLVTLFLISIIVFAATQALPSDPARAILGRNATPDALASLRKQLHLDRPVVEQYVTWLKGFVTGDLGDSLAANEPVSALLGKRLENSAFLVLLAAVISVPLSLLLGAARSRHCPSSLSGSCSWCCSGRRCRRCCRPSRSSRRRTRRGST